MYKAILEVGGFNVGDIVPDAQAQVWLEMYDVPHVKLVKSKDEDVSEPETVVGGKDAEASEEPQNVMLDDYLARGKNVVCANIKKDGLSVETLKTLLTKEKEGKNRDKVIRTIEDKIKEEVE